MTDPAEMREDFRRALEDAGQAITIRQWVDSDFVFDTGSYDNARIPNASGTNTSGLAFVQPLSLDSDGDVAFRAKGRHDEEMSKLFIHGSLTINHTAFITCADGRVFSIMEGGIVPHGVSGTVVFNTLYARASGNDIGRF